MSDSYYKSSDQILVVNRNVSLSGWSSRSYAYIFDFEFRGMTVLSDYNGNREKSETHPFASLDPDMVQKMYDKLVDLGGNPTPPGPIADPKRAFAAPAALRRPDGGFKP